MSEPRRPSTRILDEVISRDDGRSLIAIPLTNVGGISTRVYRPPVSANPASRILDDARSRAQLFQPSPLQRVERWRGQVVFPGMAAAYQNARYRNGSAIGAGSVKFGTAAVSTPSLPPPRAVDVVGAQLRETIARIRGWIGL